MLVCNAESNDIFAAYHRWDHMEFAGMIDARQEFTIHRIRVSVEKKIK